jgi:hypothetical protein
MKDLFADLFEQMTRVFYLYARLPIGDAYKQSKPASDTSRTKNENERTGFAEVIT